MSEPRHNSYRLLAADDEVSVLDGYSSVLAPANVGHSKLLSSVETELFGEGASPDKEGPVMELDTLSSGRAAIEAVGSAMMSGRPYSVAFIDVRMPPGINGVDAAAQIRAIDPNVEIVFVTGHSDFNSVLMALKFPPINKVYYVEKPFGGQQLWDLAVALCRKWSGQEPLNPAEQNLLKKAVLPERPISQDPLKELLTQMEAQNDEPDLRV